MLPLKRYTFIYLFLWLGFVIAPGSLSSQDFQEYINFQHLGTEDGLSQGTGNALLQDHQGYLWIGTDDGLNKYDGVNFTVYRSSRGDTTSIQYNEILALFEDSQGNIWVGTGGGGLSLFNRQTETFRTYISGGEDIEETTLTENTINCITEDRHGFLWIGNELGVNRLDPSTETFHNYIHDPNDPSSISDNRITHMIIDRQNTLWIATRNGLNYKKDGESGFHRIYADRDNPQTLSRNHIWELVEDQDGFIWIGTNGGGLNRMDPSTFEVTRYERSDAPWSLKDNSIYTLFEDSRGVLWVGGESHGLFAFDKATERFYHYQHDVSNPNSLSFNSVHSIYETNNHILWIGTFSGPLNYIDLKQPRFEHYRNDPYNPAPLSHNNITSFYEARDGRFWVGTDGGGLNKFDRELRRFSVFRHDPGNPNSLTSDVVLDITEDSDGYLWLSQYNGGATRFNPDDHSFYHHRHDPADPTSISHDNVFTILIEDSIAWIGTHGDGLNRLNLETGTNTVYSPLRDAHIPGHLENAFINTVIRDSNGILWIGTYGNGLARYNEQSDTFDHFARFNDSLSGIAALSILEDRNGSFWVATENGLNLFDREDGSFTVYDERHGLPNAFIHGLVEDKNGHLWVSHNEGISKFYPAIEAFENYGVESGLQRKDFNFRSYYHDRDGYIYFGGPNGFNRFHPDNVEPNTYVAPVVFTDFLIFNQPVPIDDESPLKKHISQTDEIVVQHHQSVLTFEFVTLNYEIQKRDRYAYRLDGFDHDWNMVGDKRSATYTNLNPGEYFLRVRAANSDGIWGEQEATLSLIITPPYWRTTWFYIFSTTFILGLLFSLYRFRVRAISRQNRILERKVQIRTEELQKSNITLRETLEELQSTRDQLVEKAHKAGMADLATNVLHDVGNILNSVNVSTAVIRQTVNNSHVKSLRKANDLLKKHMNSLEDFILDNPKGKKLLEYYIKLDKPLTDEYEKLRFQNDRLAEKIDLIIDVISAQQSFSTAGRIKEKHQLEVVVNDTLKIAADSFIPKSIALVKHYQKTGEVILEKTKIIHVLVNLLKNAAESIDLQKPEKKEITIRIWQDTENAYLSVSDTGTGFDKEIHSKIFKHGFTSKPGGHGFGLHGCANYIKEMNGSIIAESEGPGKGAVFTMSLPLVSDEPQSNE